MKKSIKTTKTVATTTSNAHIPSLTDMETRTINALIDNLYAEVGFSDVGPAELSEETKIPMSQMRGILSSLQQKQLIWIDDREGTEYHNKPSMHIVYLDTRYYFLHPEWAEKGEYVKLPEVSKPNYKEVAASIVKHAESVAIANKTIKVDDPKVAKTLLKSLENKTYQELAKLVGKTFLGKSKQELIKILTKSESKTSSATVPATKASKKAK